VRRDGALVTAFDAPIAADRVVAVPQLTAQRITGVPASWWGFVPTDISGRVEGLGDVYAAGDMTAFPIKQGALAAQQADRVANAIVEGLGVPTVKARTDRILLARLLGGERALCLRTELDESGQPTAATIEHIETRNVERSAKVFGQYLTPYLERMPPTTTSPLAAA
jgi:sulfide:quinone oxidoreductase